MRRALPLALCAALLAPPAAGALPKRAGAAWPAKRPSRFHPPSTPQLGIADQKDAMFGDPRFRALGIQRARYAVAWDAMSSPWQAAELDSWLALARSQGVEPLLTFSPSRLRGRRRAWPSPAAFVAQFRSLREKYPWVTTFATWNEANFCGFGPCHEPARVARWWRALSAACPRCTILGAEVLDYPNAVDWTRAFVKAARREPKVWGYHNYVTANRFQLGRTRDFLHTVPGDVWFTETGGLVRKTNVSTLKLRTGVRHAANVTRFILEDLATLSPRVKRVYLYQWSSRTATDTWDSGLVGPDGTARPSLGVLEKAVAGALDR